MEINGKQVWDSEDMVFLPLITEFLSIKVQSRNSCLKHAHTCAYRHMKTHTPTDCQSRSESHICV